jgi:hypothetical protein
VLLVLRKQSVARLRGQLAALSLRRSPLRLFVPLPQNSLLVEPLVWAGRWQKKVQPRAATVRLCKAWRRLVANSSAV